MIVEVTSPPPAPPRVDRERDASAYTASASSFITILTAVNASKDSSKERPATATTEEGTSVRESETTPETDPTPRAGETAETENAQEPESADESTATTLPEDSGTEADQDLPDDGVPAIQPEPEVELPDLPAPETAEEVNNGTPSILSKEQQALSPANTSTVAPEVAQSTLVAEPDQILGEDIAPAAEEGDAPDLPAPSQPAVKGTFPKTLNAFLAENAVKAAGQKVPEAAELTESIKSPPQGQDLAMDNPLETEGSALPQATATEVGGVRSAPMAATPRIPLANLPGEIVQQIHLIQTEGNASMKIRLSPEHLGELRLEIHRSGDTVRVTMISPNPHVRDALDSQMAELRKALEQQGLNLGEASVEDQPRHQRQEESFRHPNGNSDWTNGVLEQSKHLTGIANATPGQFDPAAAGPGGINILA